MPDCIFCRVAAKKVPSKIIYEDERCVAFEDINPQAPVHTLVIPKRHLDGLSEVTAEDAELLAHLLLTANRVARDKGILDSGYRAVINSGPAGGQTVFHLHVHLLGGRAMRWPPG